MTVLHLNGRITETGELDVRLPGDLPPGEAHVTIEIPAAILSPAEIEELLRVEPMDGAEIVEAGLTGGWADEGITDSLRWVEEQRRRRRELRSW